MNMNQSGSGFYGLDESSRGRGEYRDDNGYAGVRDEVRRRLMSELSPGVDSGDTAQIRRALRRIFDETLNEKQLALSSRERRAWGPSSPCFATKP